MNSKAYKDDFEDLTIMCAFPTKESPLINCGKFNILTYFIGSQERTGLSSGITDYTKIKYIVRKPTLSDIC